MRPLLLRRCEHLTTSRATSMTEPLAGGEDEGVMVAEVDEQTVTRVQLLLDHLPLLHLHLLVIVGRAPPSLHDFFPAVPIPQEPCGLNRRHAVRRVVARVVTVLVLAVDDLVPHPLEQRRALDPGRVLDLLRLDAQRFADRMACSEQSRVSNLPRAGNQPARPSQGGMAADPPGFPCPLAVVLDHVLLLHVNLQLVVSWGEPSLEGRMVQHSIESSCH
mmetsp:Transcript_47599/g.149177  ORF Transcript_47599/g.149177 Transcript_47599/m.149177 type:complete len:218 (+) Transcript_47599:399-1052(+)